MVYEKKQFVFLTEAQDSVCVCQTDERMGERKGMEYESVLRS